MSKRGGATRTGYRKQAEVNLEQLTPRCRQAWEHRLAGATTEQTAKAMKCTRENVWSLWNQAMKTGRPGYQKKHPRSREWLRLVAKETALTSQGRCRCGLLLPCTNCLPTLDEIATSRVGEGGIAPRPSSHSGNPKTGAAYR